jgi:hypothetical protein
MNISASERARQGWYVLDFQAEQGLRSAESEP